MKINDKCKNCDGIRRVYLIFKRYCFYYKIFKNRGLDPDAFGLGGDNCFCYRDKRNHTE